MMLFLLGIFQSTASVITCCLYELALNQQIQEKLREKIVTEAKKHDGVIPYDFLDELNYLEMVVCGTLSNTKLLEKIFIYLFIERILMPPTQQLLTGQ